MTNLMSGLGMRPMLTVAVMLYVLTEETKSSYSGDVKCVIKQIARTEPDQWMEARKEAAPVRKPC